MSKKIITEITIRREAESRDLDAKSRTTLNFDEHTKAEQLMFIALDFLANSFVPTKQSAERMSLRVFAGMINLLGDKLSQAAETSHGYTLPQFVLEPNGAGEFVLKQMSPPPTSSEET